MKRSVIAAAKRHPEGGVGDDGNPTESFRLT
jgi:hypothetical protein